MSGVAIAFGAVIATLAFAALRNRRRATASVADAVHAEVAAIRTAADAEAEALRKRADLEARSAAHEARAKTDEEIQVVEEQLVSKTTALEEGTLQLDRRTAELKVRSDALADRDRAREERERAARELGAEVQTIDANYRRELERIAGESADDLRSKMVADWLEEARAAAAERLRRIEAGMNDPEHGRTAKRIMTIAVQRYQGHYLTERLLTNVPIAPGALAQIAGADNANLRVIEEVSHVTLLPSETGEAIRLEGQDSFGREIARRALNRFGKNAVNADEARKQCLTIAEELDREVMDLGKRAFRELEIQRAHPDIVKLVGKLNYRTSYTQNQWKHAVEAAFLCGMMAAELGLDEKLARRAALMHDIGKALTHEIDGSHAVIGADLARKLGEQEVVANAIGAHHTDEPFNTAYAFLVAAADAMSGARPGARRQQDDNYAERLEQLERIASLPKGVERVYAVHGGREVRIHVQEGRISDERAVEMSTEIAKQISDEMTFPGQIKVTVIREVRATSVAS